VSRRSMLVQTIRRNTKQQKEPHIIICGGWGGREPIVTWALHRRKPTPAEIASAIAEWKRERATYVEPATLKPSQGAGDEGETQ